MIRFSKPIGIALGATFAVAIGAATFVSAQSLIGRADDALYQVAFNAATADSAQDGNTNAQEPPFMGRRGRPGRFMGRLFGPGPFGRPGPGRFQGPGGGRRGFGGPDGPGARGGRGGPGGPGALGPAGPMLRGLDVTEAQRTQIQTLVESRDAEMRAIRERGRTARQALEQAITASTVDEAAIRARSGEWAAVEADAAVARANMHAAIVNVLTPEQKAQLEARRSQGPRR